MTSSSKANNNTKFYVSSLKLCFEKKEKRKRISIITFGSEMRENVTTWISINCNYIQIPLNLIHDERENVEEDDTQTHTQLKLTALQHRVKLEKEPFRTVPAPSFWFMKTTQRNFLIRTANACQIDDKRRKKKKKRAQISLTLIVPKRITIS